MSMSPRQKFLSYVRNPRLSAPVVSPFLPDPGVVKATLTYLGLSLTDDAIVNEITLARALGYQPMFMTDCTGLIFNWEVDETRSSGDQACRVIRTARGEWVWIGPRKSIPWNDDAGCPVQTEEDHDHLVAVCEQVAERGEEIRAYFRRWREAVGEEGVIVIGHPHPSWLGFQINPTNIFYQWTDCQDVYRRSMDALCRAAMFVMSVAVQEGIDFMSDSSYGLEMTSPGLFAAMDLPYIQKFARWTHEHGGLFWYHNCGSTRTLIKEGVFNTLGADVIETIAPPPEGDNDLAESRRHIDGAICTKGNLNLRLLRDGSPDQVAEQTRAMVAAVRGFAHVISTADAVLPGTPPENFISFVSTARDAAGT